MVSVCIASYNGERYIKEQIDSILKQLSTEDEIIISDDNSTDDTLQILSDYKDSRISVYKNQGTAGLIHNFQNALSKANGNIIFLSDQDDLWHPNKVECCINQLKKFDLVLTDCRVVNENGQVLYPSFMKFNSSQKGVVCNLIKNSYIGCCMAFKKDILKVALPFPQDIPMHDIWIGFVAELFYSVDFIYRPLVDYRRHDKNASISGKKSHFSLWKKTRFRINTVKYFFLAYYRYKKISRC